MGQKLLPFVQPGWCEDLNVAYFPQLGHLVAVRVVDPMLGPPAGWESQVSFPSIDQSQADKKQFTTDEVSYFKSKG